MLFYKRPYLIFKNKPLIIKKYINKYLNKGFIYFSIFLAAAPIFLTKKPAGGILSEYKDRSYIVTRRRRVVNMLLWCL